MKTNMTKTVILATALLFGNAALADVNSNRADARQQRQVERIGNGIDNGSLTRRETARLANQQAHIHRAERRFESDGHLSKKERSRLELKQDRASRNIYRTKHNPHKRH